jgi:hypothetical protein
MKSYFLSFLSLLMFLSCSDNFHEENINLPEQIGLNEIKILNKRLYFPNKSTFTEYYNSIKEKEETEIADILNRKFYSQSFYSLKPIVNDKTEKIQMERHLKKIKKNKIGLHMRNSQSDEDIIDDFDDLEDIFGEEVFASFLNQEAEIQIGTDIYKYTDTGLFITNENKIIALNNYLDSKNISKNFLEPTDPSIKTSYKMQYNRCGGYASIEEDYQYYIAPDYDCGGDSGSGSGSGSGDSDSGNTQNYYEYQLIANNLDLCSGSEPGLANLFGTVKVCKDKYENRRRVKVKYWNVNFGLGYSIGIKVKHQYRGWTGFWRKQTTDKIVLGINSVSWKFKRNYGIPNTNLPARYYVFDGTTYETQGAYDSAVFVSQGSNPPVPGIPFADNIDIAVEWFTNDFGVLDTELKVRQLFYQFAYDRSKDLLNSKNRQLNKAIAIIHTNTETWVQYYDFSEDCIDCKKIRKVFDWGIATPSITFNLFEGYNLGNVSLGSFTMDFNNPDLTGLSVFGMAKREGVWHGKRMEF